MMSGTRSIRDDNNSDDPKAMRWKLIRGAVMQMMLNAGQIDASKINPLT